MDPVLVTIAKFRDNFEADLARSSSRTTAFKLFAK